ncbi:retrovirus-related pol polyprotein from transposon 297 [Tanacetum coccineum]
MVSEPVTAMNTRHKTNIEFQNEVNEILARHESSFKEVNATLQTILTELQALQTSRSDNHTHPEINPFFLGETSNSTSSECRDPHNHQLKLQIPKFDGKDPTGFIFNAEQYFQFQNVGLNRQVELASFHLEGIAFQWYRWLTKFHGPVTWAEFTKALLLRFGPTDFEDPYEALSRLRQTSDMEIYIESFENLSHRVDGLPKGFLIGSFIAGLQDDIRLDVKIKRPRTLADTIGVSRLVNERNKLSKKILANQPLFVNDDGVKV